MPTNYKILGQTAPLAAFETLNYTVPSLTSTMVKSINITNRSATSDTFSIALASQNLIASPIFLALQPTGAGGGTSAASSTDGITWTTRTLPANVGTPIFSAFGNKKFVFTTDTASTLQSTDGITWTSINPGRTLSGIVYANSMFVAVSPNSTTAVNSTDGITWNTRTLPVNANWTPLRFGNNTFVALASTSTTAASSTDGITWTERTLPSSANWLSLAFGNGVFAATAFSSTAVITSTDGIAWTTSTLPTTPSFGTPLTFGNGVFVVLYTNSTTAASSTDGITWTLRTLATSSGWNRVTFGNGIFLSAAAFTTRAITSTDGITWTTRTLPTSSNWWTVSFGTPDIPLATTPANYIAFNSTVPGNSTVTFKAGYTLPTNGDIRVISTNGTSTFSTFGAEIS